MDPKAHDLTSATLKQHVAMQSACPALQHPAEELSNEPNSATKTGADTFAERVATTVDRIKKVHFLQTQEQRDKVAIDTNAAHATLLDTSQSWRGVERAARPHAPQQGLKATWPDVRGR